LSIPERNALELFVQENADLQEELDMLKQSIVKADDIVFKGKSKLFKPEIISAETEEQLLLHLDGELATAEVEELETALINDNSLATQFQLLQQTKLSPADKIVFVNKELLYRKEDNKVIPFGWWKLAVAAVFIGFGIWGTAVYLNSKAPVNSNATASNAGIKPTENVKNTPVVIPPVVTNENSVALASTTNKIEKEVPKNITKAIDPIKIQEVISNENKSLVTEQKIKNQPDNHLPKPYFENINSTESNKKDLASVTPQTLQNALGNIDITAKDNKVKPATANNNVYTAAFTDNSDENKEDRFSLSEDEPKKSKLSGFLRKAKRVLERNTKMKSGDDNVKVANLEFAIQ
jgi:hypothetical protein